MCVCVCVCACVCVRAGGWVHPPVTHSMAFTEVVRWTLLVVLWGCLLWALPQSHAVQLGRHGSLRRSLLRGVDGDPNSDVHAKFGFANNLPLDLTGFTKAAGAEDQNAAATAAFGLNVRRHIGNLKAMSFNLRSALHRNDTGVRDWEVRKVLIAAMLNIYRPHVLAVQEGTPEMLAFLASAVPGYVVAPHLAEHGHLEGNTNGVLYNATALHIVASTQFWFATHGLAASAAAAQLAEAAATQANLAAAATPRHVVENESSKPQLDAGATAGAAAGARAAVAAFDARHPAETGTDNQQEITEAPEPSEEGDGGGSASSSAGVAGAVAGTKAALGAFDSLGSQGFHTQSESAMASSQDVAAAPDGPYSADAAVSGARAGAKAALRAFDLAANAAENSTGAGESDIEDGGAGTASMLGSSSSKRLKHATAADFAAVSKEATANVTLPHGALEGISQTHQLGAVYVTFTVFCIKPSCAILFGVVNVHLKPHQAQNLRAMEQFGQELLEFVDRKCDDIFCIVVGDFGAMKGGNALYRLLTTTNTSTGSASSGDVSTTKSETGPLVGVRALQDAWTSSSMHMGKARVSFNDWHTCEDSEVAARSLPVSGTDFQDWILCVAFQHWVNHSANPLILICVSNGRVVARFRQHRRYHQGNATVEVPSTAVVSHQFAPEGSASDFVLSDHFPVAAYFTVLAEERDAAAAAAAGNSGWSWGFSPVEARPENDAATAGSSGNSPGTTGDQAPGEIPSLSIPPLPLAARDKLPALKRPLGVAASDKRVDAATAKIQTELEDLFKEIDADDESANTTTLGLPLAAMTTSVAP